MACLSGASLISICVKYNVGFLFSLKPFYFSLAFGVIHTHTLTQINAHINFIQVSDENSKNDMVWQFGLVYTVHDIKFKGNNDKKKTKKQREIFKCYCGQCKKRHPNNPTMYRNFVIILCEKRLVLGVFFRCCLFRLFFWLEQK